MNSASSGVSIIGIGQVPVEKHSPLKLRDLGLAALRAALDDAGVDQVDAVFVGNMLADELQGQKHLAALLASAAGLRGAEALQVGAATAAGAAALRLAYLAVASGSARRAVALGVEKMSDGEATPALAKALDAEREVPAGATLLSQNARLMGQYLERYGLEPDHLSHFAWHAHRNARANPNALFRGREVSLEDIRQSRVVCPPLRVFDAAPICDGAAAVVLAAGASAGSGGRPPVQVLGSSVATDWFCMDDRPEPLELFAVQRSARQALAAAGLQPSDLHVFELHDAFSIMTCLTLEALGFAPPGQGWRLAADGQIAPDGRVPVATLGGLKARGHPIGASALYQTCEIVLQLTGRAGPTQVPGARRGMLLSVGGVASTAITHLFGV